MKIITIGCTHAGTAAIVKATQLYKDAEFTIYERNDNVSFLSCGIALYVEGIVKDINGLFYSSPEKLAELGANTKMKHEVLSVDVNKKVVSVKNLETNEVFEDSYDKLIVTSGSWPINPNIEGKDLDNIQLCKNFQHAKEIIEKNKSAKNVCIVGAGYIGIELVNAFLENKKNVTLIDVTENILSAYLDKEFIINAEESYKKDNVTLALGEKVVKFEGSGKVSRVVTDKGQYDTDLVILCIGFAPATSLFKDKLEMMPNGAIIVDEYMRTSNKDIVAAGDCCSVIYNPTGAVKYLPLATNAVRMGTLAAINLFENKIKYIGTQGTSGIKIYDECIASTGLSETAAKKEFSNVKTVTVKDNYRPEFMPTTTEITLKLVYNGDNNIILGAQLSSKADFTQIINTISICIQNKMTIEEVAFVDQFFQPHFNKPWSIINVACLSAL